MTKLSPSDLLEQVAQMDQDELSDLLDLIKVRRRQLSDRKAVGLRVGDTVSFPGRTRGFWSGTITGTVEKKNPKKAKIRCVRHGRTCVWNVPYSMITKA